MAQHTTSLEGIGKNNVEYVFDFMDLLIGELYHQDERLAKLSKKKQQLELAKAGKLYNFSNKA